MDFKLIILAGSLIFYWAWRKVLFNYIPTVPKLTQPFIEVIEINTADFRNVKPANDNYISEPQIIMLNNRLPSQLYSLPIFPF